jgi:uncharacterized phage protein gp47/JayE
MPDPGLTPQGFVAPTVDEEVLALNAEVLANVDAALDLDPDQPVGQWIGVNSKKFADIAEILATVYNSMNPDEAEGQLLKNIAAISGTRPQIATYSIVKAALLTLNAGATAHAGDIVTVAGQSTNRWVLLADVTNPGGSPAAFPGDFRSEQTGAFVANAGTLTVIETPEIGWTAVTNPTDAVAGLVADTDTTLRQKREIELAGEGSGDIDSIRAAVLKVEGVLQVFIFENITLSYDAVTGLPPKSFRVVIWDGPGLSASNAAVAQAIWTHKGSASLSYGTTLVAVTDSGGNPQPVRFDRATQLRLYVVATTTPGSLSTAGTAAVKASLAAYAAATFNLGEIVIALPFRSAALVDGVDIDVPSFQFGFTPAPTNTGNLGVTGLQIATLATTDILVNGV